MEEKVCALALNRIFGHEPAVGGALIGRFGSAASVFGADMIAAAMADASVDPDIRAERVTP